MPLRHREEALKLPERHLLPGLGGDALQDHLRSRSRIQMRQESVDTGLAPAGKLLAKVDELADGLEGVLVLAGLRGLGAEHVADERGVANLLVRHVLDQGAAGQVDASLFEFLVREAAETLVKEIKLNPFLKPQCQPIDRPYN